MARDVDHLEADPGRSPAGGVRPSVRIERLGLEGITKEVLEQLRPLYADAYHDSRMYESLLEDVRCRPAVFQLFLAQLTESHEFAGAVVVESRSHSSVDYRSFRPVHSKRLCVRPSLRGNRIGRRLLAESRRYCFEELGLAVTFGISNEIGALVIHGQEGALYHLKSIEGYSSRNGPSENVEFFQEFLSNEKFRTYRIPIGKGIQIVYCRDTETRRLFEGFGYVSRADLLGAT